MGAKVQLPYIHCKLHIYGLQECVITKQAGEESYTSKLRFKLAKGVP